MNQNADSPSFKNVRIYKQSVRILMWNGIRAPFKTKLSQIYIFETPSRSSLKYSKKNSFQKAW